MDTKKVFRSLTISTRERRSWVLSYRRYKRLTKKEKDIFDNIKSEYYPNEIALALQIKAVTGKPLKERMFRLARKWYNEAIDYYMQHGFPGYCIESSIDSKYIAKELEFEGFIPLQKFRRYKDGYGYIISQKPYNGTYWIWPEKFKIGLSIGRHKPLFGFADRLIGISGICFSKQIKYINYPQVEKELEKLKKLNDSRTTQNNNRMKS